MKKLIYLTVFLTVCLTGSLSVRAQCTASPGFQCVPQATMDRTAKALDEIPPLRALIAAQAKELGLKDDQIKALNTAIAAWTGAFNSQGDLIKAQNAMIEALQKLTTTALDLAQKLQDKAAKPKSGFAKFADTLEKIALIALGVSIARL